MNITQNGTEKWFVTSDLHLGHEKSIKYDKRPFTDVGHMHRVLVNNYNAVVGPNDLCYFLGDIGWHDAGFDIIPKLNGFKVLVLGNHDPGKKKMYEMGFNFVLNAVMINVGQSIVTMTHCPLRGVPREGNINQHGEEIKSMRPGDNWHGEWKHKRYSLPDFGQFHLHGHTHKWKENDVISGRQWDIGIVGNNYRPVSHSQIEAWIQKYNIGK